MLLLLFRLLRLLLLFLLLFLLYLLLLLLPLLRCSYHRLCENEGGTPFPWRAVQWLLLQVWTTRSDCLHLEAEPGLHSSKYHILKDTHLQGLCPDEECQVTAWDAGHSPGGTSHGGKQVWKGFNGHLRLSLQNLRKPPFPVLLVLSLEWG